MFVSNKHTCYSLRFSIFVLLVYPVFYGTKAADTKAVRSTLSELNQDLVGAGYSGDTQQVVPQKCFNAKISSTSGQQARLRLDSAVTYSELERELGVSLSVNGNYGMFSGDAKTNYLRSVKDKAHSLSLSYYSQFTNQVKLQLAGYGDAALTATGKTFYKDGKNPYFGLVCGDHYITSYHQGALLIMGIIIEFRSAEAKKDFSADIGASFGDVVSASSKIKKSAQKRKLNGSVSVQAFQIGGEPSQLSKILSKDSAGQFYALTCSLTAMDNCVSAASGLLNYAKEDFPKQISFEHNKGLTTHGVASVEYNPIGYIGLKTPASLVTPEVVRIRREFSCKLLESDYYLEKLHPFLNDEYLKYYSATDTKKLRSVKTKANNNIGILMQRHNSASACFSFPDRCKNIKSDVFRHLKSITKDDLKFLDSLRSKNNDDVAGDISGLITGALYGPAGNKQKPENMKLYFRAYNATECQN